MIADSQRLRELLAQLQLSQRAGARELDVKDRQMRYWAAGKEGVPRVVMLALEHLICLRERQ
jgi:hypothetical protein